MVFLQRVVVVVGVVVILTVASTANTTSKTTTELPLLGLNSGKSIDRVTLKRSILKLDEWISIYALAKYNSNNNNKQKS